MKVKKYQKPSGPITAELTPSQAIKYNNSADNAAFMIPYGGTPKNPEFLYPEELRPAIVIADKSVSEQKKIDQQVSEMMSGNDWLYRPIGGGKPEHSASVHGRQYVQPLVNAAVWGIGGAMGAANPITTTFAPELLQGAGHAAKVMMNPASAKTMTGAFLGTAADSYFTVKGLQRNSELLNKWWNGNFNWSDLPEFGLNMLGVFPYVKAADNAFDAARTANMFKGPSHTAPMTKGDPGLAQDYINSISPNAEVTSSPRAITRSANITDAERMGIPKAERNNAVRIQNPIVNDVLNNHKYGTINPDELIETVATESSLGSYSNDPIKKFVSTLDIDTHPAFTSITKDGKLFEHPSVTEFRNYLNNNGVDASVYSTDELSKLLTYEFLDKTKTATGALKDMILWHATDGNFDAFDFMTHLGKNTRNRGLYGIGNYFSTKFPQQYGVNSQPFIISGINDLKHYSQIKSWRNMPIFKDKTVPKGLAVLGSNSGPYVKTTFRPYMNYEGIAPYEIVVPKNHGIKSLFPHPSRFIQQPDGSVILKSTDWDDIRFNFKHGGKIRNMTIR